jgi:O-antigen/teichoic acid export membrane protein
MGIWALFLIVTGIFELIKSNLLKNAQIKFGSASTDVVERSAIASSSLLINALVSSLFILFILLFANALSGWLRSGVELAHMLRWFIPGIIFMIFFSHLEAIQQSHLDFKGVFAGHFVRQSLFFGIIVFHKILGMPFSLTDLAIYQSISIFFGAATLYFFSRKYLNNRFNPSTLWVKKILNYGGYIFGSGTVAGIFQNLDQLMISRFGVNYVAPYNAAFRINALVDIPSYAASEVLFPKASLASVEEGPKRIKYLYEKMVAILLSFTIPTALFIIIFPGFIITIIAGPNYLDAVPILQLYMVAGILRPAQNQAANLLNSIGKAKLCFYINLGYLLVNLVLNYICLIYFGFYGAALGTVITFIIGAVVWYFIMKKEIALELSKIVEHAIEVYKMCFGAVMNIFQKKQTRSKPV